MTVPALPQYPLVSIVTPSFNQAAYLDQTITSVLEQDYPRLQYLLIDGGSTDGSLEIIKKHSSSLAFWISESDSGQAEAINKGFSKATGEIVAWLNSDDTYLPGAVSSAVDVFKQNPEIVLVYGNMIAVDANGQTMNYLKYSQLTLEDLLCFQIIGQPAVFFRRTALEKAGFLDLSYSYFLDHHLWLRIAMCGRIRHVNKTWATARFHAEAKNRAQAIGFGNEAFRILNWVKMRPDMMETFSQVKKRAHASAFRVDARYLLDGGQAGKSLVSWLRALLIHPPTALARINIFASALLVLIGLGWLREIYLQRRQARLKVR